MKKPANIFIPYMPEKILYEKKVVSSHTVDRETSFVLPQLQLNQKYELDYSFSYDGFSLYDMTITVLEYLERPNPNYTSQLKHRQSIIKNKEKEEKEYADYMENLKNNKEYNQFLKLKEKFG